MSHTSPRLSIVLPDLSDVADVPLFIADMVTAAGGLDNAVLYSEGTLAGRPNTGLVKGNLYRVSGAPGLNGLYMATSTTTWVKVNDTPLVWTKISGSGGTAGQFGSGNWVNYDVPEAIFPNLAYSDQDNRGRVNLKGLVSWIQSVDPGSSIVAVLPAGARPVKRMTLLCMAGNPNTAYSDGVARVDIDPNGSIICTTVDFFGSPPAHGGLGYANTFVSLDNIVIPTV